MKKALAPVRARMRLQHALTGLCWGLLCALAAGGALLAVSFFVPLLRRGTMLSALTALPLLGAVLGAFWPVSLARAARRADACGLRERAQTALALRERTDEMAGLQRADALQALEKLDVRRSMPLQAPRKALWGCGISLAACAALLLIPNPQDAVVRRQQQFIRAMEKPAQTVQQAADTLEEQGMDEKTAQELRRRMGELSRRLRSARDSREAMTALSQTQQQMEKLLNEGRNAASEALSQAGADSLAQALGQGGASDDLSALEQALQEALEAADAENLQEQLSEAAQTAENAAAAAALSAAAQALSQGNLAQAAQALSQLSAANLAASQLTAALQGAKAMAGGQGMGQGQGQGQGVGQGAGSGQGENAGGGAGKGSTNQEQKGSGGSGGGAGKSAGRYNLGEYEQIYDPTRLGDGGQITQSTGKVDENAQISEMTLGPGLGDASGAVPYDQVVGEYQAAAVQRAQEAALPGYAQQWVSDYFTALTE